MDVSIIMINYCTYDLTVDAIDSIFEYTKDIEYEIILIDNASSDNSGQRLSDKYKEKIKYIQSKENLGTAKGFNLGYKEASGKYIIWLNTDILLKENFIFKLYKYMENNSKCGIVGGNIRGFDGNPTHSYRKEIPSLKSLKKDYSIFISIFRKMFKKALSHEYNYTNKVKEVGYITGADMMIRKSVIDEIGPFCEEIFMYSEETEFTYRMIKNTEYKVMSYPDAVIYHLEGASFTKEKTFSQARFKRSLAGTTIYFQKCYGIEYGKKYLKLCISSYKKFIFICRILRRKNKLLEYIEKKNIATEALNKGKVE